MKHSIAVLEDMEQRITTQCSCLDGTLPQIRTIREYLAYASDLQTEVADVQRRMAHSLYRIRSRI
jgi:hypothetical protein